MQQGVAKAALQLANVFVYARHPKLVLSFYRRLGYWPNVCHPGTKHEKFLWRKIFDRNPMYRLVTDKLAVRQFVRMRCPDLVMSEIVWIGASPEQIPDALLQTGMVIKANNGSGRNIFITDVPVNRALVNKRIARWLSRRYGAAHGEWVYSKIQPYVFIEKLIRTSGAQQFVDMCCHTLMGKCVLVTLDLNSKQKNELVGVFDAEGRRLPVYIRDDAYGEPYEQLPEEFPVPTAFVEGVKCAESIARNFDYIRVDFMISGNDVYFCECTIFPMCGLSVISGGVDDNISAAWDLRNSWFIQRAQRGIMGVYSKFYRFYLNELRIRDDRGRISH
jgi:hypothetical protein